VALWADPAVHGAECRRFDSYLVTGPDPDDCDFITGAIGTDGSTSTAGAAEFACGRTATHWAAGCRLWLFRSGSGATTGHPQCTHVHSQADALFRVEPPSGSTDDCLLTKAPR
jgi:hypothetical protein